jgi:glycosyltransferase involved in cell wall biosynthesis
VKNKKILLSAYACEPNKGSEPGVGWHWALEIERLGYKVWVLTRKNNQEKIEDYWQKNTKPENLNFFYYDVPKWLSWWKKGGRGVYIYYLLWQFGAYFTARCFHKKVMFDKVQHITFVTVRQPSFMGLLGIPFIFGPVGGGERAPYKLRKGFSLKGKVKDFFRDMANFFIKLDPLMYLTFVTADEIYTTSEQTKELLPTLFKYKTKVQLAIGFDAYPVQSMIADKSEGLFKLLYVGRYEYWKGMGLGIQAFDQVLKSSPNSVLTMVGKGPDKELWQNLAKNLGIADKIIWIEWLPQNDLIELYQSHDLFLFPSLHDSGGMVVLEAMSHGLPVVCLNLGGPAVLVDDSCGLKVQVDQQSEVQVINKLCKAILHLIDNKKLSRELSAGAIIKAKESSWSKVVKSVFLNKHDFRGKF